MNGLPKQCMDYLISMYGLPGQCMTYQNSVWFTGTIYYNMYSALITCTVYDLNGECITYVCSVWLTLVMYDLPVQCIDYL